MIPFHYDTWETAVGRGRCEIPYPLLMRCDKFLVQDGNLQSKLADRFGFMMLSFTDSPCAGTSFSGIMEEERKNGEGWAATRQAVL